MPAPIIEIDECADIIRRGEYAKAVLHLSRIATSKPNDPEANILKGLALYSLGRYPEALEACRVAMNYGGDLSEKYEEMWHLYEEEKMDDEASECRLTADFMDEIIMKAKYVGAKALFRMGILDDAIHEINFEMRLDPDDPGERHVLTMILGEMCHVEDMDSKDASSTAYLHGQMYSDFWSYREELMGRLSERLKAADLAVNIHGDEAGNHAARAEILLGMGKHQDALEAITEALRLNPLNARYHYLKADALRMLGRLPECRKAAEESLSLDPDDQEAQALNGYCLHREGRRDEGGKMVRSAYEKDATCPMTCFYMAYVALQEDDRKTALDVCKSAMLRHPERQELRYLMATMLEDVLWP